MVQVVPPEPLENQPEPPPEQPEPVPIEAVPIETPPVETPPAETEAAAELPPGSWASPTELLWRKWLLMAAVPVAVVVVGLGAWSLFSRSGAPELPPVAATEEPQDAPTDEPVASDDVEPQEAIGLIDPRWVPDGATLVVGLNVARLRETKSLGQLANLLDPFWQPTLGTVLRSFGLKVQAIDRLTLATVDLADWPTDCVVVIRLAEGQDARFLAAAGESVDLDVEGIVCRRFPNAPWPHPLAVLDSRTIVSADVARLRRLARRSEPHFESPAIRRLLEAEVGQADGCLLVDLTAVRQVGWPLPSSTMDVWPSGKDAWHVLWEMPVGVGCWLQCKKNLGSRLALVCEGETAARQLDAAVDTLVTAAEPALSARVERVRQELQAGQITVAEAARYEELLQAGLKASVDARHEVLDETVWVRIGWQETPRGMATAVAGSRDMIRTDWRAAALAADRKNHTRLGGGLASYQKAQRRFPSAVAGGALLPPETRLSWITTMLPYYGHGDWYEQLETGYSWNGPQNRSVTKRPLPEAINPALGPAETEAGFPVTHYVGVAGVGDGAGRLKAVDPRAGVFGFGRSTSLKQITDGASHTMAILGVAEDPGPWAAGGRPTVRSLTQRPYVNGPDGFGSGQPHGMLAAMADGSVRFLSKDVDPAVIEALATIAGGEDSSPPTDAKPEEPPVSPGPTEEVAERPSREIADIRAGLAEKIPGLQFRKTPLARAVGVTGAIGNLSVTLDPDAMQRLGVGLYAPITLDLSETTVQEALEQIAKSQRLAVVIDQDQVLLTDPPEDRQQMRRQRYTVSDLTGGDLTAAASLVSLIEELVMPDTWQSHGGRGTIEPIGKALDIEQTGVVHYGVLVFCEKLRRARGLPLRSRVDARRFELTTRFGRAKENLGQPVSVTFPQPTALIEVLGYLGEVTEVDILVDRRTMADVGLSDRLDARLSVREQPFEAALQTLLQPLDLGYRIIDATTLQVTTRKAVAARPGIEFYPVAGRPRQGEEAAALIERIKSSIAPTSWSDAGGPGVILFDKPSGHLIVLQSQPVQTAIERLLGQKAEK